MKSQVFGLRVASVIFALVGLVHVLRLIAGWEIAVGSYRIGATPSFVAVGVCALIAAWLGSLSRQRGPDGPTGV